MILLGAIFVCAALTDPRPITFIHPKRRFMIASYQGVEVPIQTRIEPDTENRVWRLEWSDGSSTKTLNGADESALQPIQPLKVRLYSGTYTFIASVYGPAGKLRQRGELDVMVCGGEGSCGGTLRH